MEGIFVMTLVLTLILTTSLGIIKKKIFLPYSPGGHIGNARVEIEEKKGWRAVIWGSMYIFVMLFLFLIVVQIFNPNTISVFCSIVISSFITFLIYLRYYKADSSVS